MRNYRILRLANIHFTSLVAPFLSAHPQFHSLSYEAQQKLFFDQAYVYSDTFSKCMNKLGNDAYEVIHDLELTQKTWAKEHGVQFDPKNWEHEIVLHQIAEIKPDVLYFQDIYALPHNLRKEIKKKFPFIKLIVMYKGFPGSFNELDDVDLLFLGYPKLVEQFQKAGCRNSHLIYHAFDTSVLDKLGITSTVFPPPRFNFTFLGSSGFGYGLGHQTRYNFLVDLIEKTDIELWVYDRILPDYHEALATGKWRGPQTPLREKFPQRCHGAVFGAEMYKILAQSKLTFNLHTDAALNQVANIRLFQATGVGTCLLTDSGKNMTELFEEDYEVATYSSQEECLEKMLYLLEHEDERKKIARAGHRRTLGSHTYMHRCRQMNEIITKKLKKL